MKRYLNEFIGTFFLMMTFVLAISGGTPHYIVSVASGAVLAALIIANGSQRNAHFNPAMTFSFFLQGGMTGRTFGSLLLGQFAGAMLAGFIGRFLIIGSGQIDAIRHFNIETVCAIPAEFLGAFLLVWVFLNSRNSNHGLTTGLAMMAANAAFGSISLGVFNPAVAIGLCLSGFLAWPDSWIFVISPLVGGAAAATVFQIFNGPSSSFDEENREVNDINQEFNGHSGGFNEQ